MPRLLICAALAAASLVTEAQAPYHYTAYEFVADEVAQCLEDAECGSDTECMESESACIRELTAECRKGGR